MTFFEGLVAMKCYLLQVMCVCVCVCAPSGGDIAQWAVML